MIDISIDALMHVGMILASTYGLVRIMSEY